MHTRRGTVRLVILERDADQRGGFRGCRLRTQTRQAPGSGTSHEPVTVGLVSGTQLQALFPAPRSCRRVDPPPLAHSRTHAWPPRRQAPRRRSDGSLPPAPGDVASRTDSHLRRARSSTEEGPSRLLNVLEGVRVPIRWSASDGRWRSPPKMPWTIRPRQCHAVLRSCNCSRTQLPRLTMVRSVKRLVRRPRCTARRQVGLPHCTARHVGR